MWKKEVFSCCILFNLNFRCRRVRLKNKENETIFYLLPKHLSFWILKISFFRYLVLLWSVTRGTESKLTKFLWLVFVYNVSYACNISHFIYFGISLGILSSFGSKRIKFSTFRNLTSWSYFYHNSYSSVLKNGCERYVRLI